MAKIKKPTPQNNIPVQESKHKGIPVTDVKSAQEALMAQLQAPASEEPVEQEVQTEVEENTSEQAMENAESVETKTEDSGELTVDDLVDDNQEEETQEPTSYTVKVDGKDVEVTLEELQAGYSRQADYTRKSQVLAEQRQKADDEQQNLKYKQQQEAQAKWNEELARQQEIMAQRLPEWNDPNKGAKLKQNIKSFAIKKGFSEQEVDHLIDARSVDVLHKAMLYENLLDAKISKKKAKVVPKVTKPGTGATKGEVASEKVNRLRTKAKRSGGVNDAAKYLESLL
jgi:hypothetical protein